MQSIALARTRALTACSGDYVVFIDDDEEATPKWLQHLLDAIRRFQADVVFGQYFRFIHKKHLGIRSRRGCFLNETAGTPAYLFDGANNVSFHAKPS